jgi:anaerobic carbon-monoxide dehydrogenase iron sulfur subunit
VRQLYFIPERCVDCGACRVGCVSEHSRNHDIYDPLSVLSMARKRERSVLSHSLTNPLPYPMRCIHCDDAPCMEACIGGSLGREDRVFGRWRLCVGCFMCVMNCPYGAMLPCGDKAIKCDQCLFTEKPACVRACPQGALLFAEAGELDGAVRQHLWRERTPKELPLLKAKQ